MEQMIIKFADSTALVYDTEGWDDYKLIDDYFCIRKDERNVGIFNMKYIKSVMIK